MNGENLLNFLVQFILILKDLLTYAIIARIIFSWFTQGNPNSGGGIYRFLVDVTEPVIGLARLLPHQFMMMDFAPFIALLGLDVLSFLLLSLIAQF